MSNTTLTVLTLSIACSLQAGVVRAQTLTPDRVVYTSAASDRSTPTTTNVVTDALETNAPIVIRERSNATQETRRISSFMDFDLSSLTPTDVNDPLFTALFSVEYINRLNDVNPGFSGVIGRVSDDGVNGDSWDLVDGQYPDYDWGGANAADSAVFINDMIEPTTVPATRYSALVTDIVRDWVNGAHANNGFVLYGSPNVNQGGGFANPELSFDLLLGDFDLSGVVDETDFFILNDNLAKELDLTGGDPPIEYSDGDIDFDSDIDLDDFGTFKDLYPGVVAAALGVPEPHTLGLFAIASGLLTSARPRRFRR